MRREPSPPNIRKWLLATASALLVVTAAVAAHYVDEGLHRGAQPEEVGFASLKQPDIKAVLNLRAFHSDRAECRA